MSLKNQMEAMLPAIETELQAQVDRLKSRPTQPFHEMLTYHMGWSGAGAGREATGKRIRPLLVLLAAASAGGEWTAALPAAAAVELVHNFSLVHDDVQDNSDTRRGRSTVWKIWGIPMAINAGDALFVIANQALMDLVKHHPGDTVVRASQILLQTCLDLTQGQYLDMSYEKRSDLTLEDYWLMIGGKTSALLSTCTQMGALLGRADAEQQEAYRQFGYHLGLAFQVQDDILGIWGDETLTGKSASSDLVEGKNSLPVIYGLGKMQKFAQRWRQGRIPLDEVQAVAALLEEEGARAYAQEVARNETEIAMDYLQRANPRGMAGGALRELAEILLGRKQ